MKYIGISGVARAGKDLCGDLIIRALDSEYGLRAKKFALANTLKEDCRDFIKQKLNLDVFSQKTDEKKIFRDMLVWYGDVKRKQTNGRYWIEKLDRQIIDTKDIDVAIITDIRYAVYDADELHWIKNEKNGKIIHVSRYCDDTIVEYANDHEKTNDPIIKRNADSSIVWRTTNDINDPYLYNTVRHSLKIIVGQFSQ